MPIYKCQKCNREFDRKSTYDYHAYDRKYPCTNNVIKKSKSDIDFKKIADDCFECPKCHNTYGTKGNVKRHYYDVCTLKDDVNEVLPEEKNDIDVPNDIGPSTNIINNTNNSNPDNENIISGSDINDIKNLLGLFRQYFCQNQNATNLPTTNVLNTANTTQNAPNNAENQSVNPTRVPDVKNETFVCSFCKQTFSRKFALDRHIANRCKVKSQLDQQKQQIAQMKIQINKLQQKIDQLEGKK